MLPADVPPDQDENQEKDQPDSPSWNSINRRMRNLDLKLRNENDSNRRFSFDTLMMGNKETTSQISESAELIQPLQPLPKNRPNQLNMVNKRGINNSSLSTESADTTLKSKVTPTLSVSSVSSAGNNKSPASSMENFSQKSRNWSSSSLNLNIRSTCSNFLDRISSRFNNSFNFNTSQPVNMFLSTSSGENSEPVKLTSRSNSAKEGMSEPQTISPPVAIPLSVNAQCLSPRPRPKARK